MKAYLRITAALLIVFCTSSLLVSCGTGSPAETSTESSYSTAASENEGYETAADSAQLTSEPVTEPDEEEDDMISRNVNLGLNFTISADSGIYKSTNSRFATETYICLAEFVSIAINSPYKMTWIAYDADFKYLGNSAKYLGSSKKWLASGESVFSDEICRLVPEAVYIRVAVCNNLYSNAFKLKDISDSGFEIFAKDKYRFDLILPEFAEYQFKSLLTGNSCSFKAENIGNSCQFQDGAVYGDYLIRLSGSAEFRIYSISDNFKMLFYGKLDCCDNLKPHSNSVFFGTQKYSENDEFPLLYCNVYNNYKNEKDRQEGTCCVYRLTKNGSDFSTELVQIIKIGFASEKNLWISESKTDIRPYGNFACDTATSTLYAFVPVDESGITRLFSFRLPDVSSGSTETAVGDKKIKTAVLQKTDILKTSEFEYSSYPQGATIYNGLLYSLEGFNHTEGTRAEPAMKIVELSSGKLIADIPLWECGLVAEPELISYSESCGLIYSDRTGILYRLNISLR